MMHGSIFTVLKRIEEYTNIFVFYLLVSFYGLISDSITLTTTVTS